MRSFSLSLLIGLLYAGLAGCTSDGPATDPVTLRGVPPDAGATPTFRAPTPADAATAADDAGAPDAPHTDFITGAGQFLAPTKLGEACTSAGQCASGFCADGVCCDIACTGTCTSCNLDGLAGLCSPVKDAPDPGTCGAPAVCGPDRKCGKPAHETCASDDDCAGGVCRTYYLDEDGDGFGAAPIGRCDVESAPPAGYVTKGGDCCDADATVHPGQAAYSTKASACGTFDFDCNGTEDPQSSSCSLVSCGQLCLSPTSTPVGGFLGGALLSPKACR